MRIDEVFLDLRILYIFLYVFPMVILLSMKSRMTAEVDQESMEGKGRREKQIL